MAALLDDETVQAYARDGVVCVRGLLDAEQVQQAARATDTVLARPGPLAKVASSADDPGRFTEDFRRWTEVADIEALARGSRAPQVAAELLGSARVRVLSLRYLSERARHAPRRWVTSPPFDGLDAELPAGAELDHPLFPVVWPR